MPTKGWKYIGLPLLSLLVASSIARADGFRMRISSENSIDHFHTTIVSRFAADVSRRSGGRIEAEHVAEARMFRDRDVIEALQAGHVEMAVPGTWQLERFVPDIGLFLLPLTYGSDKEKIHNISDGRIGNILNDRFERRLQLKVLGRWIDLGYAHIFGIGSPIESYDDLVGRRIRVAGGQANIQRIDGLGANAFVVPWPDLPAAMAAKSIDGVLTSYATVASTRLWEKGVSSVFEDNQYFAQYVPLVAKSFWRKLPEDLRSLLTAVWDEHVEQGRALADDAQMRAKAAFVENGGRVSIPRTEEREARRRLLLEGQDALVDALGIDPDLIALATRS